MLHVVHLFDRRTDALFGDENFFLRGIMIAVAKLSLSTKLRAKEGLCAMCTYEMKYFFGLKLF